MPHNQSSPSAVNSEAFSYPLSFYLIMASTFLFFFSIHLLITPLPLYIKEVGAQPAQIGLVMGANALMAVLSRPLVGRLVDRWGRKPLMIVGSAIFVAVPLLYALAHSIPSLFLVRMLQGIGIAAFTTANTILASELVPPPRRGEAIGLVGVAAPLSIIIAPALGATLLARLEFSLLFGLAALVAAFSLLMALTIREAAQASDSQRGPGFLPTLRERDIWVPCLLNVALGLTYGSILTFLPLFGVERKIANVGLFFTAHGLMTVTVQMPLGRLSDRVGRIVVIVPGTVLLALALAGLKVVEGVGLLIVVAILYGLGLSGAWTALTALIVDRAAPEVRGMAVGLLFGSYDLGIGLGGMVMGPVAGTVGYGGMYLILGLIALAGVTVFVRLMRRK